MGNTVHSVRHEDYGALQSRRLPQFVIFNPDGDLVVSAGVDEALLSRIKQVVDRTAPALTAGAQTFAELDEASPVHIVSLEGRFERFTAVFLVRFGYRGSVDAAARFFKLTKRETEVLKLIIRSHSTGQIAELLCISPGTASDHIKSLMRKTNCTRRSELFGRVYNLEYDGVATYSSTFESFE